MKRTQEKIVTYDNGDSEASKAEHEKLLSECAFKLSLGKSFLVVVDDGSGLAVRIAVTKLEYKKFITVLENVVHVLEKLESA